MNAPPPSGVRPSASMWEPSPPLISSQKRTEVVGCVTNIAGGKRQRRLGFTSKCLLILASSPACRHPGLRFSLPPAVRWQHLFAWGFCCLVQTAAG